MIKFPKVDRERKVLFLDIDGVMQPDQQAILRSSDGSLLTFDHRFSLSGEEREALPAKLADELGIAQLKEIDPWDVAAVYLDWHPEAVRNLKEILSCGVEIVLSTGWRDTNSFENLKALFSIHGLGEYITDICQGGGSLFLSKRKAIELYLEEHPDLHHYVIVDDENLLEYFPGHCIYVNNRAYMDTHVKNQIKRIFAYKFWWEYKPAEFDDFRDDGFRNVVFLDIDGVLNYCGGKNWIEEYMAGLLKYEILRPSDAEVVLTSSWRDRLGEWSYKGFPMSKDYPDCMELNAKFARYGIEIADMTPRLKGGPEGRPFEIRAWLALHHGVEHFVILDDEPFWEWGWLKDHVVQTACYSEEGVDECGLNLRYAKMAREIL